MRSDCAQMSLNYQTNIFGVSRRFQAFDRKRWLFKFVLNFRPVPKCTQPRGMDWTNTYLTWTWPQKYAFKYHQALLIKRAKLIAFFCFFVGRHLDLSGCLGLVIKYVRISQKPTVWPDLTNFCHFGQRQIVSSKRVRVDLAFGNIL